MKKELTTAILSVIIYAALTLFLGVAIGILKEAVMQNAGGLAALTLAAIFSFLKLAAIIYFPFLSIKLLTKWRKIDWSLMNIKEFTMWAIAALAVYEILIIAYVHPEFMLDFGALIAAFIVGSVVDIALLGLIFWWAAKNAKKKSVVVNSSVQA